MELTHEINKHAQMQITKVLHPKSGIVFIKSSNNVVLEKGDNRIIISRSDIKSLVLGMLEIDILFEETSIEQNLLISLSIKPIKK